MLLALFSVVLLSGCANLSGVNGFELPNVDLRQAKLPELKLPQPGEALAWAEPLDVNGVTLRVPAPAGYVEVCGNNKSLRESQQRKRKHLLLLACYRQTNATDAPLATLSTLAHGQPVKSDEFVRYKQSLAARAAVLQRAASTYTGNDMLSKFDPSQSEVLKVLRNSKNWVVHAVVRAGSEGTEQGVLASVWLHERLLYLSLFDKGTPDWPALTDFAETWATSTIERTLWSRAR